MEAVGWCVVDWEGFVGCHGVTSEMDGCRKSERNALEAGCVDAMGEDAWDVMGEGVWDVMGEGTWGATGEGAWGAMGKGTQGTMGEGMIDMMVG